MDIKNVTQSDSSVVNSDNASIEAAKETAQFIN